MEEYANHLIYKMSGGQQQRVMIAKTLVNNPNILLLDEPTTGIDRKSTEQLMHLLHHINCHHKISTVPESFSKSAGSTKLYMPPFSASFLHKPPKNGAVSFVKYNRRIFFQSFFSSFFTAESPHTASSSFCLFRQPLNPALLT